MMRTTGRLGLVTAILLGCVGASAAQTDATTPFAGYWKLNPGLSKISGRAPEGFFNYRQYKPMADGSIAHTMISGDAKTGDFLFTVARYDGKEYPVYDSRSLAALLASGTKPDLMVTFERVNDYTIEYTDRVRGKIASHGPCTVSRDGATLTIVSHAMDAEGKERSVATLVYERQRN